MGEIEDFIENNSTWEKDFDPQERLFGCPLCEINFKTEAAAKSHALNVHTE